MSSLNNKRLAIVFSDAIGRKLSGGVYCLDGYNRKVVDNGLAFTITTRTFGDNNHFLLEIND